MKQLQYILFSILIFFLISCESKENIKEESTNPFYNEIIKNEKGIIRGVNINDNIKSIKSKEDDKVLIEENATTLEYEYPFIKEKGTYVVSYIFDDKGCYEIDVDTYFESPEPAKEVESLLKTFFNSKFSSSTKEDGLIIWKNKNISVELDCVNQQEGEIILTIYATK